MQDQRTQRPRPQTQRKLSKDELTNVVKEAARRHGEELKKSDEGPVTTMDDAYSLARELGIPEEFVEQAARDIDLQSGTEVRVSLFKKRRFAQLMTTIAVGTVGLGLFTVAWLLNGVGFVTLVGVAGLAGLITLIALIRWTSVSIKDLERSGGAPVAGICRVCGRPSHTPESTFCEEHRYKTPE